MQIGSLTRVFDEVEIRRRLRRLTGRLVAGQLERLGWEPRKDETHFDSLLRPVILGLGSFARIPEVMEEGLRRWQAAKRLSDIQPDIQSVVLGIAVIKLGDTKTFQTLLKWHKTTPSAEERNTIAGALTSFKKPEYFEQALGLIDSPTVRLQDVGSWLSGLFGNRHAKAATWKWLKKKWPWIEKNFGSDMIMSRFPLMAGRSFAAPEMLKEYDAFFAKIKAPGLKRGIAQGHEILEWQMLWRERDEQPVRSWLSRGY